MFLSFCFFCKYYIFLKYLHGNKRPGKLCWVIYILEYIMGKSFFFHLTKCILCRKYMYVEENYWGQHILKKKPWVGSVDKELLLY